MYITHRTETERYVLKIRRRIVVFRVFFFDFFYPHEKNKTKQRMRVAVLQDIEKRKHIQRQREHERRNEDMSNPKS